MRAFLSLYITNLFLIGGTGLLTTYIGLYLSMSDVPTFWIGALSTVYYLGLLLGAKQGYYLIKSVGHIRSFAASMAIVTACVAAHGLSDNLYFWLVLRLLVGASMMCIYMVLESWLNEQAEHEQRGRVFSVYMITTYLGMMLGQLALSYFPELGYAHLFLICIALALGIVPIAITKRIHPKPIKPIKVSLISYFRRVPQALIAVLFAGIISGSFYALGPVFALKAGLMADEVAMFMTITILAGLVAQWPMGVLSDTTSRSTLLRFSAIAIATISILICFMSSNTNHMFVLTFAFGIFAFTLYPLASALANSEVEDEHRVGVSSALLAAFAIGAAIGSTVIAQLMSYFNHLAFYGAITVLTVVMFITLTYLNKRQKKEHIEHSDYVVSASDVTTSPLAASMDPRIDEELAQEQLLVTVSQDESNTEPAVSQ